MKIIAQHRALVAFAVAGLAVAAAQAQSGRSEAQWQWKPGEAIGESVPPLPPPTTYPVQLVLDDDTSDGAFGVGGQTARQFLWFNRFSAAGGFHLDEVWVLFPSGANMAIGGAVQISIYEDPDNDPTNGANWLGSFAATIQAADDNTFSIYPVPGSPVIPAGSDLLVGVVPRFIVSGVTSPTLPAALDTTATQSRSWVAAWTADPPDPPVLVPLPDQTLSLVDAFVPGGGNFMIRAFGTEQAVTEIPTLGGYGLVALALALGVGGALALRRRKAATALALLLLALAAPAGAVTIDTFTTNQATITDPPGTATSVAGAAGDPIGNRRGLLVDLLTGAGPTSVGVTGGALTFSVTATTPDSRGEAVVTWDGDALPNVLTATGLGGVSLTGAGHSGFRIVVNSATAGTELEVTVYFNATDFSSAARRLPAIAAPTAIFIPFDEFRIAGGSGADFAEVGAIVLKVRGTEVAAAIDLVETSAPIVAATKVDTQIVDTDGDTRVDPGDRVRYTVTVTNTGNEALAVDLTDNVDPNTTLVAGSVSSTPLAHNDQYGWFGNVTFSTDGSASKPNLLANDQDADGDTLIVQTGTFPATSARGGTLTLDSAALGSFTYNPPTGASGVDSFNYTIVDDNGNTSTATAYIALNGVIWFVDDSNTTAPFLGTFADPYQSLSSVSTVGDPDLPGDTIFVYDDNGTPYPGGIVLEADQTLLGEGVGLILDGTTVVPAGGTPQITNGAGNGVAIAANNTIRGLDVTGTSGYKFAGSNFGTLTVTSVTLAGGGGALDLDNGALAVAFANLTSTSGLNGVDLDTVSGSLLVSGSTAISGVTGTGIRVLNGTATHNFGSTTITAPAGLNLTTSATAAFNFSTLAVTSSNGAGLVAANAGTINLSGSSSTVAATNGAAVDITSTSLGSGATFATVSSTNSTAKGVNLDTVTGAFTANGGAIAGAATGCLDVNGGSGNITYAGSINCSASRIVEITARTGGTVTVSGNLTANGSATGINVANNTGGTVNFSGTSKSLSTSTGTAVTLATNTGATINFTGGGLAITTTSGAGFDATLGATAITVQGSGNTIASTTGRALNVANSTIGASNITFRSIASSGAPSGIVLNATGATGALIVTGNGSAGSGGTIQGSSTTGIALTSASNTSLSWMTVTTSADDGINGTSLAGLSLANMSVTNNGNSTLDEGIQLVDPSGAISFTSVTATGNAHNNAFIRDTNNTGGNATLAVSSSSFSDHQVGGGASNHGFLLEIAGTSVLGTSTISGTTFQNNFSIGLQVITGDTATISDLTISGNTFRDTGTGNSQEIAMDVSKGGTSNLTVKVLNNTGITGHNSHGMNFFTAAGAGTTGTYNARISGNTIGNSAVAGSGSAIGNCIRVNINGDADASILIDGNVLRQCPNGRGIEVIGRNGTGGADVTITNNDVNPQDTSGFPLCAILAQSNTVTVPNTVRSDIRGNTVPAGGTFDLLATYICVVETSTSVSELVDTAPASASCTAQLTSTNTGSASASAGCALIPGPISTPP